MSTNPQIYFNPWDPEFRANPVSLLRAAPRRPPIVIQLTQKVALVARYADVTTVLGDSARFSADRSRMMMAQMEQLRDIGPFKGAPTILTSDPPVHTRLRRLVSRDFSARRIGEMEARIRQLTHNCSIRSSAKASSMSWPTWPTRCR
jgi:cytochrome P450